MNVIYRSTCFYLTHESGTAFTSDNGFFPKATRKQMLQILPIHYRYHDFKPVYLDGSD